jgi:N-acetylglucosamine kinase-like BadF-type ATPase
VLAVDAGGSKIDVAAVARDGALLGCVRLPRTDADGEDPGHVGDVARAIDALAGTLGADPARRPLATLGAFCLAGADLPADDRRILRAIDRHAWTEDRVLRNDTFAVLRAGTDRTWGVGVVCGYGTNCCAVSPEGRTFRLPALGWIAGDWGGGVDIGESAVWHAMRSQDGRGDRTELERAVPAHFGLKRPRDVMEAIYFGRLSEMRAAELPPVVFAAAAGGDAVARTIVERQADEIVTMATTAIRRLRMVREDVHVVLGGGLFRNGDEGFVARISEGVRRVAPDASVGVLESPPVVGAALLGLDRLGLTASAKRRVREQLTHAALAGGEG